MSGLLLLDVYGFDTEESMTTWSVWTFSYGKPRLGKYDHQKSLLQYFYKNVKIYKFSSFWRTDPHKWKEKV